MIYLGKVREWTYNDKGFWWSKPDDPSLTTLIKLSFRICLEQVEQTKLLCVWTFDGGQDLIYKSCISKNLEKVVDFIRIRSNLYFLSLIPILSQRSIILTLYQTRIPNSGLKKIKDNIITFLLALRKHTKMYKIPPRLWRSSPPHPSQRSNPHPLME